ncbi:MULTISPECIES: hypothetical protein [unclassified Streptomyces]|uniref:hypothetical protein n=1 Tax=unclassified Streptomyces TaxID=2593676 RepID=UPI00118139A6|nr:MULTISPECIES: hypothetical protein [unclassified Streptomyces]MBQ0863845.1 hypothetical protein [Streptomyces sp. RK75]MBQ1122136.1 hypothetical protein [Streptomyces sp. B15]
MSERDERPRTPDLPPPPEAEELSEDAAPTEEEEEETAPRGGKEDAGDYVRDETAGEPTD